MKYMRFPNDVVLPVDKDGWITTTIYVDVNDILGMDIETFLDAISDTAVGSDLLQDIDYRVIGARDGLVCMEVSGRIDAIKEEGEAIFIRDENLDFFTEIGKRNGWLDSEITHAKASHGIEYRGECVIPLQNGREIRTDAHPNECSYVRITENGYELAYWNTDEIKEDVGDVLGTIFGCAKAGDRLKP